MAIQDLGDNGAGITTLMNIGYVELGLLPYIYLSVEKQRARLCYTLPVQLYQQATQERCTVTQPR